MWLAPLWGYALGPLKGLAIRRLIRRVERYRPPVRSGLPVSAESVAPIA